MSRNGARRYPPIPARAGFDPCPLTFQQERVLHFCQLDPDSSMWDINTCKRLIGELDAAALARAVGLLCDGHPVLRTRISPGTAGSGPMQSFDQDPGAMFRHVDASAAAERDAKGTLAAWLTEICQAPISRRTYEDRLFQVVLITLGPRDHALLLRTHHVISDAASVDLLWRDLALLYDGLRRGDWPRLTPRAPSYADYAAWQRHHFAEGRTREQEAYWLSRFQDEVPPLDLPADDLPSPGISFKGGLAIAGVPLDLILAFQRLSEERRVLPFSSLLSAYFVLLSRLCQQEDITAGVLFPGRHYCPELEQLAGFFVNMTAVRADVRRDDTFARLVDMVHEHVEAAYFHQDYPFERLVQKLAPRRGEGRMPLVRTMFNVVVRGGAHESLFPEMEREEWIDLATQTSAVQADLIFDLHRGAGGAEIRIEHNTDIFHTDTVLRLAGHYVTLLRQLAAGWDVSVGKLRLWDEEERRRITEVWTPPRVSYDRDACVHELFEARARRWPSDVAVVDDDLRLTYEETGLRANQLARALRGAGVGPDDVVAIVGGRSAEMVVGQLAILKAGGAYLPIARDTPRERIQRLLRDASPRALVLPSDFREEDAIDFHGPVLRPGDATVLGASAGDLGRTAVASNLACVIYTSGSTGEPKGVMVEHRSVVNLATNADYLELRVGDRLLQTGDPSSDATTFEIWGALLNGLQLHFAPDEVLLDATALGAFLAVNRITTLFLVPPLFNRLVEEDDTVFGPLRYLVLGGDVLSAKHVALARETNPSLTVIDAYGPTENTTCSTCYPIAATGRRSIPIGRPIPNSTAYVLDGDLSLLPPGAAGELYVGGDGLARGYLGRPELTAEKFVPSRFTPGERLYRTGDLARRHPDGLIELLGRADRQVKVRGFRIELAEIEHRLREHPGVKEAVVTAVTGTDGNKSLCAYFVAGREIAAAELRERLAGLLPDHMVPSCFRQLERMPLTASGKIDQRALPPPPRAGNGAGHARAPLSSDAERTVARIWEELLETTGVGASDNFFEIGGHSFKASALASRLAEEFDVDVTLRTVFDAPTVAELAAVVSARRARRGRRQAEQHRDASPDERAG